MDALQQKQVLDRAQEIELQISPSSGDSGVEDLLKAAGEAGIGRDAVMQALRERLSVVETPLEVGDFVLGRLPDGISYPGNVSALKGDVVRVQFSNGSSADLQSSAIRRFKGLPNEKVYCDWPGQGWIKAQIQSFDPKEKMVNLLGPHGKTKWYMLHELRDYAQPPTVERRSLASWIAYAAIGFGSCIFGGLLTWLALR